MDDAPAPDSTAQRYAAWADRMRAKRQRDQARIAGDHGAGATDGAGYWAAEDVLGDGRRDAAVMGSGDRIGCLGVLGLDVSATSDDVATAYRALAKLHHPDRWAGADAGVQQEHAELMMRVNAAYHALRSNRPA